MVFVVLISSQQKYICCANVQEHQKSMTNDFIENEFSQEKMDQFKTSKDEILIVRLPSNNLLKYTSYKDVSILHFRVPADTRTSFFTFKAFEESKSAFHRKCKPRDVTLHLKASSYPVISPENITFPRNFLNTDQRSKIYNLQFQSDEFQQRIVVNGPNVGNWFAIAFVSWTDPNNERIEQQGLAASCETLLLAEMSVSRFRPTIINNGQVHNSKLVSDWDEQQNVVYRSRNSTLHKKTAEETTANNEIIYKFYVPSDIAVATARITFAKICLQCPDVSFHIQANAFPNIASNGNGDESNYIHSTIIKPNQTGEITFQFYVQPNTWHYALLKFVSSTEKFQDALITSCSGCPREMESTYAQPHGSQNGRVNARMSSKPIRYSIEFSLQIDLHQTVNTDKEEFNLKNHSSQQKTVNSSESESNKTRSSSWRPVIFRNIEFYPLLRQTYREFFMFDYDILPDANGTVPAILNLTAGTPAGFKFELGEVYDVGGTLSFGVSMRNGLKGSYDFKSSALMSSTQDRTGILAERLIGQPSEVTANSESDDKVVQRSNKTIIVCMHIGEPGVPTWPDKCLFGRKLFPASSIVNNTDANTSTGLIHVPFPESGQWYVTMGLYCHGAETAARVTIIESLKEFIKKYASLLSAMKEPCACANNANQYKLCLNDSQCLMAMNETETLKIKECMMDSKCTTNYIEISRQFEIHHKSATEQHFALDNCNASVVFTISSSPCVAGRCGRFGRCYHYMSGGFVFSTCVCMKGYRGWDCTEDTQVPSSMSILLSCLMLTLSNLVFLPSIYMATKQKYYTEAVIYFFAMFFSIFYHACDSGEDEHSFCLIKISVLQFCDFYCGLLAIWVTLIAMAHIRQQFVSLLHMLGAVLLALGTELNKQSLWVFLAPALTGICIISVSWSYRCHSSRKWFPARRYLTIFMPLGTVLVMLGLVCYAFLQTKQNYHIVHSVWHMVMALSILCLLPSRKSFIPKC